MSAAPLHTPAITVIVRTMWRASLPAALRSVALQGRDDVEVLVVDAAAAGVAAPALPDIGLPVRVAGGGGALSRVAAASFGLRAVRTRWAIFLDDDDEFLPGHLDKLAGALRAAPEAIGAHTGVLLERADQPGRQDACFDAAFEPWELLVGNRMPIHAVLFDAARIRAAGIDFDAAFDVFEDWDFWLQLQQLGSFVFVPGVSARYVVQSTSSDVHRFAHGSEAYWRVWRKWWPRAPATWWNEALRQREVGVGLRQEIVAGHQAWHTLAAELRATADRLHGSEVALNTARFERATLEERLRLNEQLREAQQRAAEARHIAAEARIVELSGQLHRSERQAGAWRAQAAAADIQRRRVADELGALQGSASWGVTAPLRQAAAKAGALRERAGRLRRKLGVTPGAGAYRAWVRDTEPALLAQRRIALSRFLDESASTSTQRVSVLMPVFNPRLDWLDTAIASLQAQWWPHWQLCIADDASTQAGVLDHLRAWASREPRITLVERARNGRVSAATNDALHSATGAWVALLDQDDALAPSALAEVMAAVHTAADAQIVFTDEDKLDARGRRFEPHRKGVFSVERLRGQNFVNHLLVMRREKVLALGGLREGYEGAQDHDLLLRATEGMPMTAVLHVPQVLYHWRCTPQSTAVAAQLKPYALGAALRAVNESLARCEPGAQAEGLPRRHYIRVRYPLPEPDGVPVELTLGQGLREATPGSLDELRSLLARPGVGAVGGCVVDGHGRAAQLPMVRGSDDSVQAMPESFAQRWMVQDVHSLPEGCFMLRPELPTLAEPLGTPAYFEALRRAGWRVLWTPFAIFRRS